MMFIKFNHGTELGWHVGNPVALDVQNISSIQADGDELSFALECLKLDATDHNPRVQTFVGPAARQIASTMVSPRLATNNVLGAVGRRAAELGGEVVSVRFHHLNDSTHLRARGVVHWKRENAHYKDGEEHIVHYFFVTKSEEVASFESGIYTDADEAVEAYKKRCW